MLKDEYLEIFSLRHLAPTIMHGRMHLAALIILGGVKTGLGMIMALVLVLQTWKIIHKVTFSDPPAAWWCAGYRDRENVWDH